MAISAGNNYSITITSVVDADTITADFPDGQNRTCRLFGIDAPETIYASSEWPAAFPSLPPNLQTQQYGSDALIRFNTLLIGGTGSPTPVGLTFTATVRDEENDDGLTVVTIENDLSQDVGGEMVVSGHAVVRDQYASTIPSIYNIYQANENTARTATLIIWTTGVAYYPWDYRNDVDEAARRILYIVVESTHPVQNSTDCYVDDNIIVTFNRDVDPSYRSGTYFKLYRTNQTKTTFEAVATAVSGSGMVVAIDPIANMGTAQNYMLVVVGGPTGVQAVDNSLMDENHVLEFISGSTVRPVETTDPTSTIDSVELWVDADDTDDEVGTPSSDLFSYTEGGGDIVLLSSIPANHSVGVYGLSRMSFVYNDDLEVGIPYDALRGRYSDLPIDADPLGNRDVYISGVVTSANIATFNIEYLEASDTVNREYMFTLAPGVAKGVIRTGYDQQTHIVKFMGRLTPLYATPDQIKSRLTGWHQDMDAGILDYDLYKLIHEKSVWADNHFGGAPTSTEELIDRNRLVVCLVLYDLLLFGAMIQGGVKSRSILMNQVVYYDLDYEKIKDELDNCMKTALASTAYSATIQSGIKSGKWIYSRQGKNYGVYR